MQFFALIPNIAFKDSQKWSRGEALSKFEFQGLDCPFFGAPEKGLEIYFTVSVTVLIHRCICICYWKSTKTPPKIISRGHISLHKSTFRVQMSLFSVYQLFKKPRISAIVSKDTVVYASCKISTEKIIKGPSCRGDPLKLFLGSRGH